LILLSIGPGPQALSVPELTRQLREEEYSAEVILERGARNFVGPSSLYSGLQTGNDMPEALLFYPATTSILCRLARGLNDGEAAEAYLSGVRPSLAVPSFDGGAGYHPAVVENLRLLEKDGALVLQEGVSADGMVTCLLKEIGGYLSGLRVLVTTGGTREPIDSVRFIGNHSSGKMGKAIARRAARMGAEVTVVAANVPEPLEGVNWVEVEDFQGMFEQTTRLAREADVLVMAAAVSDFKPAQLREGKVRRGEGMSVELTATEDITLRVREENPELFAVGFAATHVDPLPDAREKLHKKNLDLVVGNDISGEKTGFGTEENEVHVVGRSLERFIPRAPKSDIASAILNAVMQVLSERKA